MNDHPHYRAGDGLRWLRSRWQRLRAAGDRGDVTAEAVIIIPVIVVLTLLVVQFALVWHGRHVAQAAAQTAARSAAAYQAGPGAGLAAGQAYLTEVAPNLLSSSNLTVTRSLDSASASVHAEVLTVIPLLTIAIQEDAAAPLETFSVAAP